MNHSAVNITAEGPERGTDMPATNDGNPAIAASWLATLVEAELLEHDLTPSQYRLLEVLSFGPTYPSVLSDRLAMSRPAFAARSNGLIDKGLVDRTQSDVDRRRAEYSLTEKGR